MDKIQIVTANRADAVWDNLIEDYLSRIARYTSIRWQVVKPVHDTDIAQAVRKNTERLLALVPEGSQIIVLDELGDELSTKQLSQRLAQWMEEARSLSFIVGGAEGLDRGQLGAYHSLALSRLTLPHRLAQLVLVEQLYRAFSMQHNHPYHRA